MAEILDVGENNIGRVSIERVPVVLSSSLGSNVRRKPRIDDDVLFASVLIDTESPDDEKATTEMEFVRQFSKLMV